VLVQNVNNSYVKILSIFHVLIKLKSILILLMICQYIAINIVKYTMKTINMSIFRVKYAVPLWLKILLYYAINAIKHIICFVWILLFTIYQKINGFVLNVMKIKFLIMQLITIQISVMIWIIWRIHKNMYYLKKILILIFLITYLKIYLITFKTIKMNMDLMIYKG